MIEFSHRLSSSFLGVLAIGLMIWVYRQYPTKHRVRRMTTAAFILILIEGLIGAVLVRLELVADNGSTLRAIVMGLHLVNTLILTATLTLASWWMHGGAPIRWRPLTRHHYLIIGAIIAMLILSAFGAVTALGDTLFPTATLADDFNPDAHFTVRMRILHPLIAIATTIYIIAINRAYFLPTATEQQKLFIFSTNGLLIVQLIMGFVNVLLQAPVWLQLVHLLLANAIWISLILSAATLFADEPVNATDRVGNA